MGQQENSSGFELDRYRALFPITKRYCFLNHAAISPWSTRIAQAVEGLLQEFCEQGITAYPQWMKRVERVRGLFATLVGADPKEIAFVGNTSEGLSIVASGIKWRAGDKVLVSMPDFPANVYPWMNLEAKGVELIPVNRRNGRLEVEDFRKLLQPGARMIALSSVDFATGFYCDLQGIGELCKEKGLFFCVDAIQSLGAIPMDVKKFGIHFLAAGGQKWLLGPMGCGGLYVDASVLGLIDPIVVGWRSVTREEDFFDIHFELKPDATKFEPGTRNLMGIYALGAAIELLLEVGIEGIKDRIFALNDRFIDGLGARGLKIITPTGVQERSGILCFKPKRDPKALFRHLAQKGIIVSERNNLIRISPHFYNNEEEVQKFFAALDSF